MRDKKNNSACPLPEATERMCWNRQAKKYLSLFTILFLLVKTVAAQETALTIEQAAKIALEHNFDFRIATNISSQLSLLNHPGEAGMLPELSLIGSYSKADNATKQKYSNGDQIDRDNSTSENLNAEALASWVIFDGLKMFRTKNRLSELSSQGEIALKIKMEDVLLDVIRTYYEISRQQQLLKSVKEEIVLSKERLLISDRRLSNGSGSRLDLLHAKTDLNSKLNAELTQASALESSQIELNLLLGRPSQTTFQVDDSIIITYNPTLSELKSKADERNNLTNYYRKQLLISELNLKETSAARWPEVKLNAGYRFSSVENNAGFILLNRNQGVNYGVSASLPLFSGFKISRRIKSARLELINSRLSLEQTEQSIDAGILIAYRKFQDQLSILRLEEENILASKEILLITQERFKSGISNILELKEVQRSYEEDIYRLVDARYMAKMAESTLRQLTGDLIK